MSDVPLGGISERRRGLFHGSSVDGACKLQAGKNILGRIFSEDLARPMPLVRWRSDLVRNITN